jgi:ABC-type transport system involved in cytochrome bd biosynthesis fused ATPase/permease subunit
VHIKLVVRTLKNIIRALQPLKVALSIRPFSLVSFLGLALAVAGIDLLLVSSVGSLLTEISENGFMQMTPQFLEAAGGILLILLASSALRVFFFYRFYSEIKKISTQLSKNVFLHLNRQTHLNDDSVLSIVDFDLNSYTSNYLPCGGMLISQFLIATAAFGYAAFVWGGWFILSIIITAPIILTVIRFISAKLKHHGKLVSSTNENALKQLKNYLQSRREIFYYQCFRKVAEKYEKQVRALRTHQNSSLFISQSQRYLIEFILLNALLLIFIFLSWRHSEGSLSIPLAAEALILIQRFAPVCNQVLLNFSKVVTFSPSGNRVCDFLSSPQDIAPEPSRVHFLSSGNIAITLTNVELFKEKSVRLHVARNISHSFSSGILNGITGPSGVGKSTLLDIIGGFRNAAAGAITIQGRGDIKDITLLISQSPYIESSTVIQNITFPDEVDKFSEAAINKSLEDAGFPVSFINEEFKSLRLVNNGENISVGMRMRISLARGLIHQKTIMLLDEPTAGLDAEAKLTVLKTLLEMSKTRLVIVVTHDPLLIESCENLLTLK